MSTTDWVFLDAGLFIGALLSGDSRHTQARPIVEAARRGEFAACTSVGVLAEVYAALTWIGAQPTQTPEVASHAVNLLVTNPSEIRVLETRGGCWQENVRACCKLSINGSSNS